MTQPVSFNGYPDLTPVRGTKKEREETIYNRVRVPSQSETPTHACHFLPSQHLVRYNVVATTRASIMAVSRQHSQLISVMTRATGGYAVIAIEYEAKTSHRYGDPFLTPIRLCRSKASVILTYLKRCSSGLKKTVWNRSIPVPRSDRRAQKCPTCRTRLFH